MPKNTRSLNGREGQHATRECLYEAECTTAVFIIIGWKNRPFSMPDALLLMNSCLTCRSLSCVLLEPPKQSRRPSVRHRERFREHKKVWLRVRRVQQRVQRRTSPREARGLWREVAVTHGMDQTVHCFWVRCSASHRPSVVLRRHLWSSTQQTARNLVWRISCVNLHSRILIHFRPSYAVCGALPSLADIFYSLTKVQAAEASAFWLLKGIMTEPQLLVTVKHLMIVLLEGILPVCRTLL